MVVEDHALVATALQISLANRGWTVEVASGPGADDVVAQAAAIRPDCVLLDINLGAQMGSGIDLVEPLTRLGAHVVMLTAERRRLVLAECVEAGAAGWISKGAPLDDVHVALDRVVAEGVLLGKGERAVLLDHLQRERSSTAKALAMFDTLTQREALVLGALVDGLSAEEIAATNYVALTTVRSQIRAVLRKLGVRSQLAAVAIATDHRHLLPYHDRPGRDRRRAMPRQRRAIAVPTSR